MTKLTKRMKSATAAVQPGKQVLHVEPVTNGIAVHAADTGVREYLLKALFALL